MEKATCPMCGSEKFIHLIKITDNIRQREGFAIANEDEKPTCFIQCTDCSLILTFGRQMRIEE